MTLDARNVLVAELLGEVDTMLKRVEKFAPELDASHARLAGTAAEMLVGVETYRAQIAALTEAAQKSAVNHVIRRTNEVCEGSLAAHTDAMRIAAKLAFEAETGPRIDALVKGLDDALQRANSRRWQTWLLYLATAGAASAVTAGLMALIHAR
jgi:hypothetical protein